MPLVHVVPWSKENSQSMPGLSTAHKPLLVMLSLTLKPVSLNDKTGALRVTAAFTLAAVEIVEAEFTAWDPVLLQAHKQMTITKIPACFSNAWRLIMMKDI
jgi:hypothetical protein